MKFTLLWMTNHTDHDVSKDEAEYGHQKTQEIFDFVISESEAERPKADITLATGDFADHSVIQIGHEITLVACHNDQKSILFKGVCQAVCSDRLNRFVTIRCVTDSDRITERLEQIRHDLNDRHDHDDLITKLEADGKPRLKDLLMYQNQVLYISRQGDICRLCSLNGDGEIVDLDRSFFSFQQEAITSASKHTRGSKAVSVRADWVEKYQGTTDISQVLRERLPNQVIETFTGKAFEQKWWQVGSSYGLHGYRVDQSALSYVGKGRTLYRDDIHNDQQEGQPKIHAVKFQPQLSVSWMVRQPRTEIVTFGPSNAKAVKTFTIRGLSRVQQKRSWRPDYFYERGRFVSHDHMIFECMSSHRSSFEFAEDKIYWRDICPEDEFQTGYTGTSFFMSQRGQKVLKAVARINYIQAKLSQRHTKIDIEVEGHQGINLSVSQQVSMLPPASSMQIMGKIQAMTILADGKSGRFLTKLSVVPLVPELDTPFADSEVELEKVGGLEDEDMLDTQTLWSANELLKEVSVSYGAQEQDEYLQRIEDISKPRIPGTSVRLKLEDLTEKRRVIKHYQGTYEVC